MALYSLQDPRQINKTLFLQASWLIKIERPDNNIATLVRELQYERLKSKSPIEFTSEF